MRKIMFRGRGAPRGKQWFYGDLDTHTSGVCILDKDALHAVVPATVGQFTGLKDATGKEIYEGDIVIRDNSYFQKTCSALPKTTIGAVEWRDGEFIVKGSYKLFPSSDKFPIRVIGNIHDNPELLEDHA